MQITKHLVNLQERIRAATAACGRSENDVSVLAVTKGHGDAAVQAAFAAGLRRMGENYLQEALPKIIAGDPAIEWHFIGRIQTNKTRAIATHFSWVQTVDSARTAERLSAQRPAGLPPLNVCLQVCVDDQPGHGGVAVNEAETLARHIIGLPGLRLRGLMAVPLPGSDPEIRRRPFTRLRLLREQLHASGIVLDTLSMGMSDDLEIAIEEGSTMIRVGTALFGSRP